MRAIYPSWYDHHMYDCHRYDHLKYDCRIYDHFMYDCRRYELQQKGELKEEDVGVVPDIYARNQQLDHELKYHRREVDKFRNAAL